MKSNKPAGVTYTNLFTLRTSFPKGMDRISNRVPSTDYSHLSRCLKAGLIEAEGAELVLTDAGRKALSR